MANHKKLGGGKMNDIIFVLLVMILTTICVPLLIGLASDIVKLFMGV